MRKLRPVQRARLYAMLAVVVPMAVVIILIWLFAR